MPFYTGTYPSMEFDGVTIGSARMWISLYDIDTSGVGVKLHDFSESWTTMARSVLWHPEWSSSVLVQNVAQAKEWRMQVSVYADVSYGGYTESLMLIRSTAINPKVNATIYF